MSDYLEFVEAGLSDGTLSYVQVNNLHLDLFGIHPKLATLLRLSDNKLRKLVNEEKADLEPLDLAAQMAAPLPGRPQILPLNQCVRWQLLRYTLAELALVGDRLGTGLRDEP